jgi:hypothetical protein
MVAAYGISLASEAPYVYPKDTEWVYLVTGYSESIDSSGFFIRTDKPK